MYTKTSVIMHFIISAMTLGVHLMRFKRKFDCMIYRVTGAKEKEGFSHLHTHYTLFNLEALLLFMWKKRSNSIYLYYISVK